MNIQDNQTDETMKLNPIEMKRQPMIFVDQTSAIICLDSHSLSPESSETIIWANIAPQSEIESFEIM